MFDITKYMSDVQAQTNIYTCHVRFFVILFIKVPDGSTFSKQSTMIERVTECLSGLFDEPRMFLLLNQIKYILTLFSPTALVSFI